MFSLTRAVISVLLKDLKELSRVAQKKSSDLSPLWTSNKHPLSEEMGKGPSLHHNLDSRHVRKENIDMTTTFYFRDFRLISFHLENRFEYLYDSHDGWLGWNMHSCMQQACLQTLKKKYIYDGKLLVLISAHATLSFFCPAPSLSLKSGLRHTVKASWNIWKKGRVTEREATVQKSTAAWSGCGPIVFRVTQLFLSAPQQDCSLPSGCMSKINTTPCPH